MASLALGACAVSETPGESGTGGTSGAGAGGTTGAAGTISGAGQAGTTGAAGTSATGAAGTSATGAAGTSAAAGTNGGAGTNGAAGTGSPAGSAGTNGAAGRGGTNGAAGTTATAGTNGGGRGGTSASAGTTGNAGTMGAAGRGGTTGAAGTGAGGRGGTTGAAGTTGAGGGAAIDCNAPLPSGGTTRSSSNASGTAAGMTWTLWTNSGPGTITTFNVPAFAGSWNNSGDYLARLGLQWNATKTFDQYGTITAQFASRKSGTAGGYSYIGIYGWSVSPCVEFYIVDDSYNRLPFNPGNTTNKGNVTIDGGSYVMYLRNTTGTGGSKCPGVSNWAQYYSIRMTARSCGQISITEHFKAWAAAGMALGKMDQAQILIEAGGGTGSIEFPVASVTATMP